MFITTLSTVNCRFVVKFVNNSVVLETKATMKVLLLCLFASISLSLTNAKCHVSVWLLVSRFYFFNHVTCFGFLICCATASLSLEVIKDFFI